MKANGYSYYDSIRNSTVINTYNINPLFLQYTPYLSNLKTLNNYEGNRVIENIVIDEHTSPQIKSFFQQQQSDPIASYQFSKQTQPRVDPRVSMVLQNAESQYFEEKKLQNEIEQQKQRKIYEDQIQKKLQKNRQKEQEQEKERQRQSLVQGKLMDTLNERDPDFNASNHRYQRRASHDTYQSDRMVHSQQMERPRIGAGQLYQGQTIFQQQQTFQQPSMGNTLGSTVRELKSSKHQNCRESHLPLHQEKKPTYKYYTNPVVPKSFNIKVEKNLFQEVDCLIIKAKSLFNLKKYADVKTLLEEAIYTYGVSHADVFYLCGEANRRLGNLILAEKFLLKCLSYEFHSPFTYSALAYVYLEMQNFDRACALFKRALESQQSPQVAFDLAKLLAKQNYLTESLVYFTKAIEMGESGLQNEVGIQRMTEYYTHRSMAYEALGLMEMSRSDLYKIKQIDSDVRQRLWVEMKRFESQGLISDAKRLYTFIMKLDQI